MFNHLVTYFLLILASITMALPTTDTTIYNTDLAFASVPMSRCGQLRSNTNKQTDMKVKAAFQCANIDPENEHWGHVNNDNCQMCVVCRQKDCMRGGNDQVFSGTKGSVGIGIEGRSYVCLR